MLSSAPSTAGVEDSSPVTSVQPEEVTGVQATAVDCDANSPTNQFIMADTFISKCRKASIRSVFPGQHLYTILHLIKYGKTASHRTAWKPLNDSRFRK